jgi:eukaryotic-like serine/threonine-protein kinase
MLDEDTPRVLGARDPRLSADTGSVSPASLRAMFHEPTPDSPLRFGNYELFRRIGAGGMGEVFLAREGGATPRACVVKKVLPSLLSTKTFVGRFLDEAKVVVRLKHPNIARVYSVGDVNGEYFLSMEYVQGKTLSRLTRRLREREEEVPIGLVLLVGEQICKGLQYAHDAKDERSKPLRLVHRDLSPANVCISYSGDVKIIDFGAAQSTLKEEQTAPRVVIGNLTYMAPEQAKKQSVDGRADVYSCGVVLWELLAGLALPQKGDPAERWRKAANPHWEPPSSHNKRVPPSVDDVILMAMARSVDERFQSAAAFGEALARLRKQLAPAVSEKDLSALLVQSFEKEKLNEDDMLNEVVFGKALSKIEPMEPTPKSQVKPVAGAEQSADDPRQTHAIDMRQVLDAHRSVRMSQPGPSVASVDSSVNHGRDFRSTETLPFASIRRHAEENGHMVVAPLPWWALAVVYGGVFALSVMVGFFAVWATLRG